MSVTIDSILVRDTSLAETDFDGRAVVLSLDAGAYFDFNGAASDIWRMLSEPRRVAEIFRELSHTHDVDEAALSRDVLPFLQTLIERRLARQIGQDEQR